MNVPNDQLDRWLHFCELSRQTVLSARMNYALGKRAEASEQLQQLHDAAIITGQAIERAGAQRAEHRPLPPVVPLELLSTPKSRRYLKALEEAHAAAVEMDVERGYGDEGAGPASGMLEMLLADTQEEVSGAVGLVRE